MNIVNEEFLMVHTHCVLSNPIRLPLAFDKLAPF